MVSHDRSCVYCYARARGEKEGTIRCTPTHLGHRRSTYIYRFKVIDYWFSSRARPK